MYNFIGSHSLCVGIYIGTCSRYWWVAGCRHGRLWVLHTTLVEFKQLHTTLFEFKQLHTTLVAFKQTPDCCMTVRVFAVAVVNLASGSVTVCTGKDSLSAHCSGSAVIKAFWCSLLMYVCTYVVLSHVRCNWVRHGHWPPVGHLCFLTRGVDCCSVVVSGCVEAVSWDGESKYTTSHVIYVLECLIWPGFVERPVRGAHINIPEDIGFQHYNHLDCHLDCHLNQVTVCPSLGLLGGDPWKGVLVRVGLSAKWLEVISHVA